MRDDLSTELAAAVSAEREEHRPDLAWVVKRGRRVRRLRRLVASGGMVVLITAGAVAVNALQESPKWLRQPISPATSGVQEPQPGEVVEDIPEQYEAEVFAIRAVDAAGLMTLDGRGFLFHTHDETEETQDGWRVPFSAIECDPSTCRGLSGEDPETGNALTDTWIVVRIQDGRWVVADAEGNIDATARDRLIGYSLPRVREPSHWEAHAVGVRGLDEGFSVQMLPVWVGPFPTEALGSVCSIQPLDESGEPVGKETVFYQEAPSREFDRAGSLHGRGAEAPPLAENATVECRQYTGRVWELSGEPQLITADDAVVGMGADLIWRGREGFTTGVRCEGTLVDAEGNVVFEGSGRAEPLWRPGELKNYPYETNVVITTGAEPVDAEAVGDFTCEST